MVVGGEGAGFCNIIRGIVNWWYTQVWTKKNIIDAHATATTHTWKKNTPQRRDFEYTQPCLISTPYSPAGTVESHSKVISVFKRAVFTASLHLTNIPRDAIMIFIQSSLVSHYARRPLKVLAIQIFLTAMTQRFESQGQ